MLKFKFNISQVKTNPSDLTPAHEGTSLVLYFLVPSEELNGCKDGQLERPSSIDVKHLQKCFCVHGVPVIKRNLSTTNDGTFQKTKCPLQQAFHLSKHPAPFLILFLWYLLNFIGKEWKINSAILYRGQGIPKMNASGLGFSPVFILGVPHPPSSGITLDFSMWPLNSESQIQDKRMKKLSQGRAFWHSGGPSPPLKMLWFLFLHIAGFSPVYCLFLPVCILLDIVGPSAIFRVLVLVLSIHFAGREWLSWSCSCPLVAAASDHTNRMCFVPQQKGMRKVGNGAQEGFWKKNQELWNIPAIFSHDFYKVFSPTNQHLSILCVLAQPWWPFYSQPLLQLLKLSIKSSKLRVLTLCLEKNQGAVKNTGWEITKEKNMGVKLENASISVGFQVSCLFLWFFSGIDSSS